MSVYAGIQCWNQHMLLCDNLFIEWKWWVFLLVSITFFILQFIYARASKGFTASMNTLLAYALFFFGVRIYWSLFDEADDIISKSRFIKVLQFQRQRVSERPGGELSAKKFLSAFESVYFFSSLFHEQISDEKSKLRITWTFDLCVSHRI